MFLSGLSKDAYLKNVISYSETMWVDVNSGFMLVDADYNILFANKSVNRYFSEDNIIGLTSISLFKKASTLASEFTAKHFLDHMQLDEENATILKLHQIVIKDKIPVQFVYIILDNNELRSLLFHFVPVFYDNKEVIAIQQMVSEHSLWGIVDGLDLFKTTRHKFLMIMNKEHDLPIKLSPRQHEIIFLLTQNISQRSIAQILKISYGNLSKILRDTICPKFNIHDANTEYLVYLAIQMGYNAFIPQSLCKSGVIAMDYTIREKYFSK